MTIDHSPLTLLLSLAAFVVTYAVSYHRSGNARRAFDMAGFALCLTALAWFILLPLPLGAKFPDPAFHFSLSGCVTSGTEGIFSLLGATLAGFGVALFGGLLYQGLRKPLCIAGVYLASAAAYLSGVLITDQVQQAYVRLISVADLAALAFGLVAGFAVAADFLRNDPGLTEKINAVNAKKRPKDLYKDMGDL